MATGGDDVKSYAGIGSRETPHDILSIFVSIGGFLAKRGYTLRSGAAKGADQAFELGCDLFLGKKEIYLPWAGFEDSASSLIVKDPLAFQIAEEYHPSWKTLSQTAQKLLARNTHQILGWDLRSPCNFVVCWTKGGKGGGGTGQAIRIAVDKGIPIFDAGAYRNEAAKWAFNDFYKEHK